MQLTVDFENADQIATLAHLAEIMDLSRKNDADKMSGLYPRNVIDAMSNLIEAFADVLSHIDSPYAVSDDIGKDAGSLAHRMQEIGRRILEMKNESPEKPASRDK